MTLYDFIQLRQTEKTKTVWEGRFLSTKVEKEETIVLYGVYDFFCEVYYDNKKNSIVRLKPFRAKELLSTFFSSQLN